MRPIVDGGWLLGIARRMSRLTQAELAERAGLSQSVVSRVEGGRQDPGFVELQEVLAAAGWRLDMSLERVLEDDQYLTYASGWAPDDLEVRRLMPEGLCGRMECDTPTGPAVAEVSYLLGQAQTLACLAATPEWWFRAAYDTFAIGRDRGMVHAVLHCGAGAAHGAWALRRAISDVHLPADRLLRRKAQAAPLAVGAMAYAHATLAIRAEAIICAETARYCVSAAESASAYNRARNILKKARRDLEFSRAYAEEHGHEDWSYLTELAAKIPELERAEAEALRQRDSHRLHSERLEDIGTAGERILAAACTQAGWEAWKLYSQMAEHPSFQVWRPDPDEMPSLPRLDGSYVRANAATQGVAAEVL